SVSRLLFAFSDPATTDIYTLSLHDALPIFGYWLLTPREDRAAPMPWLGAWQVEVLQPLAEDRLNLGQLATRLPEAELWLQPRLRSEEHTSELQSRENLVCRLLLEKKKKKKQ